jgi:hypothetical protein
VGTVAASNDVIREILGPAVKSTSVPRKKKGTPILFVASGCVVVHCAFCSCMQV